MYHQGSLAAKSNGKLFVNTSITLLGPWFVMFPISIAAVYQLYSIQFDIYIESKDE